MWTRLRHVQRQIDSILDGLKFDDYIVQKVRTGESYESDERRLQELLDEKLELQKAIFKENNPNVVFFPERVSS